MRVEVYLPLLLGVALAALGPLAARRLPPAIGTRALTLAAVAGAAAAAWSLSLLAAAAAGRIRGLAHLADASRRLWARADPTPAWVGLLAAAALSVAAVRVLRCARRQHRARRATRALRRDAPDTDLVVVDDEEPDAFAVPARHGGRIVVTTGMLRALDVAERRVLLAHERSHLHRRHDRYRRLAATCAAVNPILIPLRDHIGYACERWADEDASRACGDRALTARALTRAAAATLARAVPGLGFARWDLAARIAALRAAPPRPRAWPLLAGLALCAAALLADGEATVSFGRFLVTVVPAARHLAEELGS